VTVGDRIERAGINGKARIAQRFVHETEFYETGKVDEKSA